MKLTRPGAANLLLVALLAAFLLTSGCAWVRIAGERIQGKKPEIPKVEATVAASVKPTPAYFRARDQIAAVEQRLNAFKPTSGPAEGPAWDVVYRAPNELLEPVQTIEDTLRENRRIEGGPEDLLMIARTYNLLDEFIGKHAPDVAWAYGLFIKNYPRHEKRNVAKTWLREHGFEPPP